MVAAEALAITEANENASPLDSLTLEDHEFVVEDGYKGPTVQGVVSNTGTESVELAEVRVRVYDANGAQLGRYLDRTGEIDAGTQWRFEAILLDSTSDIAEYDVAVLGISR
ncbi:FxLYD domain-containing protein [Halomicrococcus sp. SG-WS-1]|uniref:FxLYD domain-containing protein n=1 Tax=Halomicrococcus sp. SG-WS-1 TaxID=3439057 RepID=UPI003F7960FB